MLWNGRIVRIRERTLRTLAAIGEMVLFTEVRKSAESVRITASEKSCRHHIKDRTGKKAVYPIDV